MFASSDYALSKETAPAKAPGPSQVMACFDRHYSPLINIANLHDLSGGKFP